ncbi:MAG: site-specific integrase [Planctomycetes bacterium]|nr:site-specific integrase [Planctomycetota bacterium]
MARKPQARYYPSRKGGGYFVTVAGTLHELALGPDDAPTGPTYLAALGKFKEVLELGGVETAKETNTVRVVLETYLKHIATRKKEGTVEIRQRCYEPFVNWNPDGKGCVGERAVGSLTHFVVYRFLEHMETPRVQARKVAQPGRKPLGWTTGSQRNFIQSINAAMNWAVRTGLIPKNPVADVEKPGSNSRGADALMGNTSDEIEANHQRVLGASPADYRPFIQALKDTGARPGEIAAATAADFDEELGAFVFKKEGSRRKERFSHKNATKGKDRVIMLSGPTLETVKELVKKHPTGQVFRRKRGGVLKRFHYVSLFIRIQKKLKWKEVTCYSYRHSFATEMLKAGMDVDTLAHLMGNSPVVIRLHYSHLLADKKALREKLERFKTVAGGKQTRQPLAVSDAG